MSLIWSSPHTRSATTCLCGCSRGCGPTPGASNVNASELGRVAKFGTVRGVEAAPACSSSKCWRLRRRYPAYATGTCVGFGQKLDNSTASFGCMLSLSTDTTTDQTLTSKPHQESRGTGVFFQLSKVVVSLHLIMWAERPRCFLM